MNLYFYIKYVKYKTKYLTLKNNNILTGGGDKKNLTYLILDNEGLFHDRLREILDSKGFKEVSKKDVLESTNKFVDFFWMGLSSNLANYRFDKDLYQINSTLKTLLWRDKSYLHGKDVITNKQQLYFNMNKYFPDICSKHMAKTYLLKDIKSLTQITLNDTDEITSDTDEIIDIKLHSDKNSNKVYIIRPTGPKAFAGKNIFVVTNDKELEEARIELLKKFSNVIVSEYIQNPLLYEGRKFHLRMYILINSDATWSFWERGKAMTAKLPYIKDDWTNKEIHDSHGETTPTDIYFPEDILPKDKYKHVYQQMHIILSAVAKIIKPHVKCYEESKYCCEVFGIDFMLTDDYTVKLIEINAEAGYGAKNEDKTKYKQYCSEYFDWFYKESLLSRLFRESVMMKKNVKKTYLFVDNQLGEEFVKLLDNKGWIRKDINDIPEYVDLLYFNDPKNFFSLLKNKQDYYKIYNIKANIKSSLWRDDTYKKGKDIIVNKYQLYKNMKKQFPEIADKHMARTFNILGKDVKIKDGVYIIKPVGKYICAGEGIEYVSNKKEFEAVVNKYKKNNKYKKIIASEYIQPLLLFNNKKFHIRVHVIFLYNNGKIIWSANLHGTARHAKYDFINRDYNNLEIHDTHAKTTSRNIFFPEDFNFGRENTEKVLSQMELILSKVAEIVKPHLKCFPESNNCFQVFGIDFMVKDDFTVMLIEVNDNYGIHNENKNEYNTEEGSKVWCMYIKEFVKWIYDNGIAPVYK